MAATFEFRHEFGDGDICARCGKSQPGEFTVPAKLFQDYIGLLGEGKVELALKNDQLEIRADGKTTNIKGLVATEFPLIPRLAIDLSFRMAAEPLRHAISQVAFAVSVSDSRPELSGVACFFNTQGGKDSLVMAATDSYRLAERQAHLATGAGSDVEKKCIIPARAMQEIGRILSGYKDEVGMPQFIEWSMTDSQLAVSFGNVELVSRLIEGSFPDYKQIIPKQFRTNCRVKRTELMKAIRAASLFSRQYFDVLFEMSTEHAHGFFCGYRHRWRTALRVVEGESNKVTLNFVHE